MYVSSTGQNEWLGHCQTEDVAIQVGRQFCGHFLGPHRAEWRPAGGGRRQGHDRRMRSRANDRTAEKPSEMDYLGSIEKKAWQHLRSSLDKLRKPRVLLGLHHVQPGTQNRMFDIIADISPFNYRRPHGHI